MNNCVKYTFPFIKRKKNMTNVLDDLHSYKGNVRVKTQS